ncbi:MAG: hypothetical protein KBS62_01315 [Oscillospiraceae bacterium]|nr:hypothetical protein [Candidatus Ruminococcus equi]
MIFSVFVFLVEGLLVNLMFQPNGDTNMNAVAIVFLLINIVVVSLAINFSMNDDDAKKYKGIIMSSFIVRILILFWDVYARGIYILPNSEGDAEYYYSMGVSYAFGQRADKVELKDYRYYVGQIFKFIGDQKITVQFLHVFFAICSIILIYRILTMFEVSENVKKTTMIFAAFLPNSMMITTFFLQESFIAFCLVLSLYLYTKWWFGASAVNFIFAIIFSLIGGLFHMGGTVGAIVYVVFYFLINNKERKLMITPYRIVLIVIVLFVSLYLLSTYGEDFLGKIGGDMSAESLTKNATGYNTGGSEYTIGIQGLPAVLDLIVNTPIRIVYFICSPMPWRWRSIGDIFAFFSSALFYIYTVIVVIKTYANKNTRTVSGKGNIRSYMFILVMLCLVASFMFGWGVSNSGSALRHREKFTYIFVLLYGIASEITVRAGATNKTTEENIDNNINIKSKELSRKMY